MKQKIPDLFKNQQSGESNQNNMNELSTVLIQYCFFPRLMHSAKDALFSFQFCKLLHKLRVPNFNFLSFFGQILKCIVPAIHLCSEEEAENLGIFFLELFKQLHYWSKKEVWERECEGYGGFARKLVDPTMCITHKEFIDKIMRGTHKRITESMIFCLENTEKMHMKARCALIILNRVAPVFPNQYDFAKRIQQKIQTIVEAKDNKNQDLKTLAGRLNERLKQKVESFPEYQAELKAKMKEKAKREEAQQEEDSKRSKARDSQTNSTVAVRQVNDNNSGGNGNNNASSKQGSNDTPNSKSFGKNDGKTQSSGG